MNLSPKYTLDDWNAAFAGTPDWSKAIDIVEDRIAGRWLRWIDKIVDDQYSGFAVLALDCMVLESLWGFINGRRVPGAGECVYRDMLTSTPFGWSVDQSDSFRKFIRNGLMHDAETRGGWIVERTIPKDTIVTQNPGGKYVINRTTFHETLKAIFKAWIRKLRSGDTNLLEKVKLRMDGIIDKS